MELLKLRLWWWYGQLVIFVIYGSGVTVFTDHSAVCTVLQDPCATGKHVRCGLKYTTVE